MEDKMDTKTQATAKAWVNAGKVKSEEEYYALAKGTSDMPRDQMIVEEKPKRRRTRKRK